MIDLNILWPGPAKAHDVVKASANVGWSSVGFNVYFIADGHGVKPIKVDSGSTDGVDSEIKFYPPDLNKSVFPLVCDLSDRSLLVLGNNFFRRVTIFLMEDFKPNSLSKFIDSNDFEILSVIPTGKRSFQMACETLNCDLINLNFYCYYSTFKLRRGFVNSALNRGCFFEVSLSDKVQKDLNTSIPSGGKEPLNISFQRNLPTVLKVIPLKKLVVSSGSVDTGDMPDPQLLLGTCHEMFKNLPVNELNLIQCLTKAPRDCINKGAARRTFGTGILSYRMDPDLGKSFS